jgi:CBS domain-containing protein
VSTDGRRVEGIISEREIVRGLARYGARLLDMPVKRLMSEHVPVCSPQDTVQQLTRQMTLTRHRHVPVVEDGRLRGLVSIGDVVKNRLEELEQEVVVLREAYIVRR